MAAGRITKRTVDALKISGKEYVHWDEELTGFGVRVRPSGSKSFVAVYRTGGRNTALRRVTIGAVGKIEANKAREEARLIIRQAELGHDRAAEKARARAEMTFDRPATSISPRVATPRKPAQSQRIGAASIGTSNRFSARNG